MQFSRQDGWLGEVKKCKTHFDTFAYINQASVSLKGKNKYFQKKFSFCLINSRHQNKCCNYPQKWTSKSISEHLVWCTGGCPGGLPGYSHHHEGKLTQGNRMGKTRIFQPGYFSNLGPAMSQICRGRIWLVFEAKQQDKRVLNVSKIFQLFSKIFHFSRCDVVAWVEAGRGTVKIATLNPLSKFPPPLQTFLWRM